MGLILNCQKVECEEEILQRILSTMTLTEISSKVVYNEFLKCLNQDGTIHYFRFQVLLKIIIGDNIYKKAQRAFFENLYKNSTNAVRVIGTIIIFLSKGTKTDKIELLKTHFNAYYGGLNDEMIKQFIQDIIDANTDNCVVSFRSNLSGDLVKNMSEVYQENRKQRLEKLIMDNYDGVKNKHTLFKGINEIILQNTYLEEEEPLNNSLVEEEKENPLLKKEKKKYIESDNLIDCFSSEEQNNKKENMLNEFFELSFSQLNGEFIRNWLYDEYLKEKPYDNTCF